MPKKNYKPEDIDNSSAARRRCFDTSPDLGLSGLRFPQKPNNLLHRNASVPFLRHKRLEIAGFAHLAWHRFSAAD